MKASRSLPLAVASVLLATSSARPQAPPSFGASAELRPEEFTVSEDGKAQRLEFARFVTAGGRRPRAEMAPPVSPQPPAPPQGASEPSPAAASPLSLVVVVDLETMPFDTVAHTREAIVKMTQGELEPFTRLMLVVLDRGLHVRQPFTDDISRFTTAVEALMPSAGEGDSSLSDLVDRVENTCDGTPGSVQNAVTLGRGYVENARLGLTNAAEGLGALARYLAPVPARSRAPTRLVRSGATQQVMQRSIRDPQEILYSIAEGTGGTASVNTNELARGMRAAAADARGYYLLAYAPPGGRKEGRFYPIEVKVARPGLHVRYRRGYEWPARGPLRGPRFARERGDRERGARAEARPLPAGRGRPPQRRPARLRDRRRRRALSPPRAGRTL